MAELEESLAVLVDLGQQEATVESAQAARRSIAGYKGHLTLKRKYVKMKQSDLVSAAAAVPLNKAVM